MKVLITGGCGFVGSHLVMQALELDWDVTVYDDFSRFGPANLGTNKSKVTIIEGKVEDLKSLKKVANGSEVVFHLAASSRQSGSNNVPQQHFTSNELGTWNAVEACRENGARLVFASSWVVYDRKSVFPKKKVHENTPTNPTNPYAVAKKHGEDWCLLYHSLYSLDSIVLRFSNVYGPGDKDRIIPMIMREASGGEEIRIFGKTHYLNFVHVNDVVHALVLAATKKVSSRIFNIGSGESHNLLAVAKMIRGLTASKSRISLKPLSVYDYPYYLPDTSLARKELGFSAQVHFRDGLRETIDMMRDGR